MLAVSGQKNKRTRHTSSPMRWSVVGSSLQVGSDRTPHSRSVRQTVSSSFCGWPLCALSFRKLQAVSVAFHPVPSRDQGSLCSVLWPLPVRHPLVATVEHISTVCMDKYQVLCLSFKYLRSLVAIDSIKSRKIHSTNP